MLSHESLVAEETESHNFTKSTVDHPLIDLLFAVSFEIFSSFRLSE